MIVKLSKSNIVLLDRPYRYIHILTYVHGVEELPALAEEGPPVSTGMKAILVKHEKFNCTSLGGVP